MALKGDLQSVDLAQVFQMLALNQKVGILCIQAPRAWKALYFDERGATLYFNEHVLVDRVLAQWTRASRIDEEALDDARTHAAQHDVALIDSLIVGGYTTEEELHAAISQEMEEEIYDLFFWRDATFEFYEGATAIEGREGRIDEGCFFSTDSLIMEAARRIDEWSFIRERVPGPLEIFYPATENLADVVEIDDLGLSVFDVVDGRRNVARICEITGLPSFTVYKSLAVLLDAGALASVEGEELLTAAEDCCAERRWQDAINAYEKAIATEVGLPDVHAAVADVYEQQREYELAGYHRKCRAEFCIADGQEREAVGILLRVIEQVPTDLAAHERLVDIAIGRSDLPKTFDPVASGKELVDLYLEIGEVERVRGILERLLRDNPYDVELKKSLINVHTKAGDTRRVIELYESMAEDLVDQGQPIEAIKYLHKIVHLDRERKDVLEQIRSLYELDERRRSRRRSLMVLGATFCVLLAVAGVWFLYEQHAREKLVAIERRAQGLVEARNYAQAEADYSRFVELFPLTIVATEARAELQRIGALRSAYEDKLAAEKRKKEQQAERLRKAYQSDFERVEAMLEANPEQVDLPAVVEMLKSVRARVEQNGGVADYQWKEQVNLDKQIADLENALRKAFDIERRARESIAAGDWTEARKSILKLIEDYDLTEIARSARVPVMVRTRPEGAVVLLDGVAVKDQNDAEVRTPHVVRLPRSESGMVTLQLRLEGFEVATVEVDPIAQMTVEHVLTVKPFTGFKFPDVVTGQLAVTDSGSFLGASVRGGRVVVVERETGRIEQTINLPGLEEAVQPPLIDSSRIYIATGNGSISCWSQARGTAFWTSRLDDAPIWPLQVAQGKLLAADDHGVLTALDATSGRLFWRLPVNGQIAGVPLEAGGRRMLLARTDGALLAIDSETGRISQTRKLAETIDTPLVWLDDAHRRIVCGINSGELLCFDWQSGKSRALPLGQTVSPEDLCVDRGRILVRSGNSLILLDGNLDEISRRTLPGPVRFRPLIVGDRVYVVVRENSDTQQACDLLMSMTADDLALRWEFRDEELASTPVSDGRSVFVPGKDGRLRRFR
jgi:outer membrane protein assembly factor BamB/tetratricopeptide (TPR) repeat protein